MTRKVRVLDAAVEEAVTAAVWYERQRPGLGSEFEHAVEAVLDLLEEDVVPLAPVAGSAAEHGAKRLILKRFPYDVAPAAIALSFQR